MQPGNKKRQLMILMLGWEMMGYPGVRLSWHLFIPRVRGGSPPHLGTAGADFSRAEPNISTVEAVGGDRARPAVV